MAQGRYGDALSINGFVLLGERKTRTGKKTKGSRERGQTGTPKRGRQKGGRGGFLQWLIAESYLRFGCEQEDEESG